MQNRQNNVSEQLKSIGHKLKQLRIDKGYKSYETFALEHNLDRKQYWRIEFGTNITIKSLILVLEAHNLTLQEFFRDYT
ncbi:MAG: XRE family transcriptional regulator [Bacteroidetes bacterium]|nr:XRE family transcriptional regulator [Bacteroidota bacterium]